MYWIVQKILLNLWIQGILIQLYDKKEINSILNINGKQAFMNYEITYWDNVEFEKFSLWIADLQLHCSHKQLLI